MISSSYGLRLVESKQLNFFNFCFLPRLLLRVYLSTRKVEILSMVTQKVHLSLNQTRSSLRFQIPALEISKLIMLFKSPVLVCNLPARRQSLLAIIFLQYICIIGNLPIKLLTTKRGLHFLKSRGPLVNFGSSQPLFTLPLALPFTLPCSKLTSFNFFIVFFCTLIL